jgi:drug/metabolite transporter (DMT)-like permease
MVKTLALVLVAVLVGGAGHVMLAKAMRPLGDLTEAPSGRVGGMVGRALANPWLIAGVALQALFFFMYLALLTRADVSQILPITALDYIVVAVLAQAFHAEPVTGARWLGIALIVAGVALVSRT